MIMGVPEESVLEIDGGKYRVVGERPITLLYRDSPTVFQFGGEKTQIVKRFKG
jgi:hypothetical protein